MHGMLRGLAVGGLALALAGGASAALFTQFVAFGDSLSDAGNAAALSGGVFPPSPPYAGLASNGPTAAQVLADRLGVPVRLGWPVATAGANNYAVLGAMNDTRNYNVEIGTRPWLSAQFPAFATSGIAAQIARYQAVHPVVVDPARTLFMVWGGANDAFLALETPGATPQSIGLALDQSLAAMGTNLRTLVGLGARHILVPDLPDLGRTPEALAAGPVVSGFASQVSAAYNQGLDQLLDALDLAFTPLGLALYAFDTPGFFADITAHAAAYGFTNTTDACFDSRVLDFTAVLAGCPGYLYFDSVHPTAAAHALLGGALAATLPEPSGTALLLAALVTGALARRMRRG